MKNVGLLLTCCGGIIRGWTGAGGMVTWNALGGNGTILERVIGIVTLVELAAGVRGVQDDVVAELVEEVIGMAKKIITLYPVMKCGEKRISSGGSHMKNRRSNFGFIVEERNVRLDMVKRTPRRHDGEECSAWGRQRMKGSRGSRAVMLLVDMNANSSCPMRSKGSNLFSLIGFNLL